MNAQLDMRRFGTRLARIRHQRGWTQVELAHQAGMMQAAIGRLESGKKTAVRADTVMALAQALGISTDYLLGLTDDEIDEESAA